VSLSLRVSLRVRIVLVVVDRLADIVLSLVDLLMLLLREMATIRCAISCSFMINARLATFKIMSLTSSQLSRPNSLADPLLLIRSSCGNNPLPGAYTLKGSVLRMSAVGSGEVIRFGTC
jgi:hypothetical protein